MSRITAGEVAITLNGDDHTLVPTLRAITLISSQFGGLARARELLVAQEFGAICFVLRAGLNLSDKDAKTLPEEVYSNGVDADLLVPLIRYVAVLANGGKPLPDEPADRDEKAAGAEGNG